MKTYSLNSLSSKEEYELLKRPKMDFSAIFEIVQPIIDEVDNNGDKAVLKYTEKFDGVSLESTTLNPSDFEINLDVELKASIDIAFKNIEKFHRAQLQ
ncbi:MAG: histidinol dehydrogenase, partial [Balneolaceae bacterium]